MTPHVLAEKMLASCTLRVEIDNAAQGTAFFVAPGYAITAAHVVGGSCGTGVHLHGPLSSWTGHVVEVRPEVRGDAPAAGRLAPPPDVALIQIAGGATHSCVLLGDRGIATGTPVLARGYTRSFGDQEVTAETESFAVTGELETADPGCTLLKLGSGQAARGMSGAPVLSLHTGEVIGMVRSSRDTATSLGAWVVPAGVIRGLWPQQVGDGHDGFHRQDRRWRWAARSLASAAAADGLDRSPAQQGGVAIGTIHGGGPVTIISGGQFRDVHIGTARPDHDHEQGQPGAADGRR